MWRSRVKMCSVVEWFWIECGVCKRRAADFIITPHKQCGSSTVLQLGDEVCDERTCDATSAVCLRYHKRVQFPGMTIILRVGSNPTNDGVINGGDQADVGWC